MWAKATVDTQNSNMREQQGMVLAVRTQNKLILGFIVIRAQY